MLNDQRIASPREFEYARAAIFIQGANEIGLAAAGAHKVGMTKISRFVCTLTDECLVL